MKAVGTQSVSYYSYEGETYHKNIGEPISSAYLPFKAIMDFIVALILFVVTLPLVFIAMIAIKLESKGPVLYSQERVGLMGKHIKITKLRSMRIDAESSGAQWAAKNDNRITRVGKLLRKTRIDELPQLINVLKCEMD